MPWNASARLAANAPALFGLGEVEARMLNEVPYRARATR